jgi:pimeloyl-ACP methyl ester carboxylesterase
MWRHVVPRLAPHHDTIAATALGHRSGAPARERPARISHVIDDAERLLDSLGFTTAHLAGNSMGGWMAIELARRGRARSVCALSPGGFWDVASASHSDRTVRVLKKTIEETRLGRPLLPLLALSGRFRRWALARNAAHGDRVTRRDFLESADDVLGCTIASDLLGTSDSIAPLEPMPCPITIAWSARDRVLPLKSAGALAREGMPAARFLVLQDVGHVPMFDDPDLVARTILDTTRAVPRTTGPAKLASLG